MARVTPHRRPLDVLSTSGWSDYELLDSGGGRKLERFGKYVLARPERQAIWRPRLPREAWDRADAVFDQADSGQGRWVQRRPLPERWAMRFGELAFWARLSPFRHTGVFPEQAANWQWIAAQVRAAPAPMTVLDLFGYTGLATLAAAAAGAAVTYVDASRPALTWARENQEASGLESQPVRWLLDDAVKFVRREIRRRSYYDAIMLDPPVFGRGPKGEVWRFEESFVTLLQLCAQVLSPRAQFVLVNAYAIGESSLMLRHAVADYLPAGEIEAGELAVEEAGGGRALSQGLYCRWTAQRSAPSEASRTSRTRL